MQESVLFLSNYLMQDRFEDRFDALCKHFLGRLRRCIRYKLLHWDKSIETVLQHLEPSLALKPGQDLLGNACDDETSQKNTVGGSFGRTHPFLMSAGGQQNLHMKYQNALDKLSNANVRSPTKIGL